jgi:hypothetical protein
MPPRDTAVDSTTSRLEMQPFQAVERVDFGPGCGYPFRLQEAPGKANRLPQGNVAATGLFELAGRAFKG